MGFLGAAARRYAYGRRALMPAFEFLYVHARAGLYPGGDTYGDTGELRVLDHVADRCRGRHAIVLDVGANAGDYAAEVLKRFGDLELHSFEPSPTARRAYEARIDDPRAHVHPYAVGTEPGSATLYTPTPGAPTASLYPPDLRQRGGEPYRVESTVEVITVDAFCAERSIDRIDFLKIDVEGHDLAVLRGAANMLGRTEALQFEFSMANLDSRTYMKDFFSLLHDRFDIARVYRDGLWAMPEYAERYEVFAGANYLAVARPSASATRSSSPSVSRLWRGSASARS